MTSPIDLLTRLKAQIERVTGLIRYGSTYRAMVEAAVEAEKLLADLAEAVRQDPDTLRVIRAQQKDDFARADKAEQRVQALEAELQSLRESRSPDGEGPAFQQPQRETSMNTLGLSGTNANTNRVDNAVAGSEPADSHTKITQLEAELTALRTQIDEIKK